MVDSIEDFEGCTIKFPLLTPPKQTQQLSIYREALPQTVTPMVSGFGAIDLVRTGVNKATGLKDLCERLDADRRVFLPSATVRTTWRCSATQAGVLLCLTRPEVVRDVADGVIGSNEEQAVLGTWSSSLTVWKLQQRLHKETRRSVCLRGGADLGEPQVNTALKYSGKVARAPAGNGTAPVSAESIR